MKKNGFQCDKCSGIVEWMERCQSYVCQNQQCRKHFWDKKSEREICKHCGYQKQFECQCGGNYIYSYRCGAYVCDKCEDHRVHPNGQHLARCFCGWGMYKGERLEDDIGESNFDGESWNVEY